MEPPFSALPERLLGRRFVSDDGRLALVFRRSQDPRFERVVEVSRASTGVSVEEAPATFVSRVDEDSREARARLDTVRAELGIPGVGPTWTLYLSRPTDDRSRWNGFDQVSLRADTAVEAVVLHPEYGGTPYGPAERAAAPAPRDAPQVELSPRCAPSDAASRASRRVGTGAPSRHAPARKGRIEAVETAHRGATTAVAESSHHRARHLRRALRWHTPLRERDQMPMDGPTNLEIAILGDGVAGTACALRLARSGHRPVIVGRRARSARRGHGFLLDHAARAALRALGLDAARVAALGAPIARYEQRLPHGEVEHLEVLPSGTFGVMRAALMAALVEALPSGVARRDADVRGLTRNAAGSVCEATLDDGTSCAADLFVVADGARSVVRGALFPAAQLRATGDVELIGHVRDAALARRLGASFVKYQHPNGGRAMGLVPCGDDFVVWYIQRACDLDAGPALVGPAALHAFARETLAGWDPSLHAVLDVADFDTVYRARVADLEPLARLHVANAALVGDAAHLFLPFASQGVRFALDDALALGDALDAQPLPRALDAYDAARREPIARTVAAARVLRERFVAPPVGACAVPIARTDPSPFSDEAVPLALLRTRAYNLRWATLAPDVIPLSAADPDFAVAPAVREAVSRYAAGGVFSYGPAEGLPAFREACAEVMRTRKGVAVNAGRVLAVDSAAAGMRHVARLALRPGDEAIIFDPVDFLFKAAVEDVGATVRLLPVDPATGRIDLDALPRLLTARTRMLGVCNPHNPVGRVFTRAELLRLGEFAVAHDLTILDDGVWSDIVYEPGAYVAMASLSPAIAARTFSVHGFSKTFGLAGLRIGYVVAPSERAFEALVEVAAARTTMTGATTLSQVAATAAYTEAWPWAERFLAHLRAMRDLAHRRLGALRGVTCLRPEGTYVLFPAVRAAGVSSEELAARLLREARVAVVPGAARWFGPGAEGRLRVVFSTSEGILREALDRVEGAWARVIAAR